MTFFVGVLGNLICSSQSKVKCMAEPKLFFFSSYFGERLNELFVCAFGRLIWMV
jgi:hypothetical protein